MNPEEVGVEDIWFDFWEIDGAAFRLCLCAFAAGCFEEVRSFGQKALRDGERCGVLRILFAEDDDDLLAEVRYAVLESASNLAFRVTVYLPGEGSHCCAGVC